MAYALGTQWEKAQLDLWMADQEAKNKRQLAVKLLNDRQLPDWCNPDKNVTSEPPPPLAEQDSEFTLTEHEKEILAEDPTYVYPLPIPIPASPYWSDGPLNEVIVSEVENPNDFYIRNSETSKDLKILEDAMYEYYQANWKVAKLFTMNDIVINGFYAVYSFETGGWHRAKVLYPVARDDGRRPDEVLIFMVDHGKTDIVTLECVTYLRQHHVELPIQAAWASLNVPGIDSVKSWDDETIRTFKDDVGGKSFGVFAKKIGHCSEKHMTRVKVVLREKVDGQERIYTLGNRLVPALLPKKLG